MLYRTKVKWGDLEKSHTAWTKRSAVEWAQAYRGQKDVIAVIYPILRKPEVVKYTKS